MLTAEDHQTLRAFVETVELLRQTKLGRDGFPLSCELTVGTSGMVGTADLPDEGDLTEYMMVFRQIWDDHEPASFSAASRILRSRGDLSDQDREDHDIIGRAWRDAGREGPMKIDKIQPRTLIQRYFYADKYFHRGKPHEREERLRLEQIFGRDFIRALFIDPMSAYIRAAVDLANLCLRVLDR